MMSSAGPAMSMMWGSAPEQDCQNLGSTLQYVANPALQLTGSRSKSVSPGINNHHRYAQLMPANVQIMNCCLTSAWLPVLADVAIHY